MKSFKEGQEMARTEDKRNRSVNPETRMGLSIGNGRGDAIIARRNIGVSMAALRRHTVCPECNIYRTAHEFNGYETCRNCRGV